MQTESIGRRRSRVSHLSFARALKRMLRGRFTPDDIAEETGLARRTIYELLQALLNDNVITLCGKISTGRTGPQPRQYELQYQISAL